ncbi:DUF1345 domain-containing protein [Niabella drilacis]|uniref:Uncharacterized membrane protein n=1 Tax=Niabella drilacis (strain DSM 25811 / CCM 8410 / CCUG 62505 / LMG 26954 / E90) TaxID=1285928 RepID=A0A1G6SZU5_NIADE|nr:DUF1345 domain-containing protein [Niabella drilacis]SDD21747.1 Uncharacterized membrane protein [Niabella drilacis]
MQNQHPFRATFAHRLRAIDRVYLSLIAGSISCLGISFAGIPLLLNLLACWFVFCVCYLSFCWYVIYTTPHTYIVKRAAVEDGSRIFVFIFILLACFACLGAVLSIVINIGQKNISDHLWLPVSIAAMTASWLLVHTIYTFHYAHLYYQDGANGSGLHFPGGEKPDYQDFAYYALCMGCTFQVSDVDTTSKKLRMVTMYHGLISFALNTFLVALTINIISGLIH